MSEEAHLSFYEQYVVDLENYRAYADAVEEYLQERVQEAGFGVHAIFARAKEPDGLQEKLRRKKYTSPQDEITDLVGARIITYYGDQVDDIAAYIRTILADVDDSRSVDKRAVLSGKEFGYRSVHLIGTLPTDFVGIKGLRLDRKLLFEVQVRTLLEHAWAQIEHEVVYKSGLMYPNDFLRRFGAVAGTLEILDREFVQLREYKHQIIAQHKAQFQALAELEVGFDTARLIAFLEITRPDGDGWYVGTSRNRLVAPHSENSCVEILAAADLGTPQQLLACLNSDKFNASTERFAADSGCTPKEVPHYTVCLLAAANAEPAVVGQFPDLYGFELTTALEEDDM